MTKEQYFELIEREQKNLLDLIKRKNNDYTAGGGPFDNFNVTAALDLSDRRTGLLIRMVDKIQRLKTFIKKGSLQVQGEGAKDAARDIIGYSLILLGMLEEDEQAQPKIPASKPDFVTAALEEVAAARAEKKPLKLEVGKAYRQRDGEVVVLSKNEHYFPSKYPFKVSERQGSALNTRMADGRFMSGSDDTLDIVAEA